ncbi:hypothetical protein [Paenibacillus qinlingensis]|uniref:Uncharacterized protein n=1 Tax=Paenibacillus qinlingensis TaxID=1837343 RepID=A0ABU1P8Y2_9BACL|nr:hypothetical protein [Paenibacillus qinlingensis]MDR6555517.1 hypothetical protein [Paenibacillus qinlingensis]
MKFGWILLKYIVPPASLALLLFAIGLWSNYSEQAKTAGEKFIAPLLDFKVPIIFSFLILYYLCVAFYDYSKGIVNKKDEELAQKDEEMKEELSIAIKLNKKYSAYRRSELLLHTIQTFVNDQPYIQAIQVYNYEIKHMGNKTRVKIKYQNGFIEEGIDLNAMDQAYYLLDKRMFTHFQSAYDRLNEGDFNPIVDFIQEHGEQLRLVTNPTDDDVLTFAFVELALGLIETRYDLRLHENYLTAEQTVALEEHKRTGVLRTILLKDDFFIFKHLAIGFKQGRVYSARHLNLWGDNMVYLITLHPDILVDRDYYPVIRRIDEMFMERLRGLLYNGETDRL